MTLLQLTKWLATLWMIKYYQLLKESIRMPLFNLLAISFLLSLGISCESNVPIETEEEEKQVEMKDGWNGFVLNEEEHSTPNAIIEIYGENLDSLSSNFDISFTDGTFNEAKRTVIDYTILVYFDVNSPDLDDLKPGTYNIENTSTRKPGNVVQAYILFVKGNKTLKYPILGGNITVTSQSGSYLIQYELLTMLNKKEAMINGQYSGIFTIKDQTRLN